MKRPRPKLKHKFKKYIPKPYNFPDGFNIITDTREQLPLFKYPIPFIKGTVHNGDYTIQGFENQFFIERKMIGDFYQYVGRDYKKTLEKIRRVDGYEFKGLVIEASYSDIFRQQYFTKTTPESARSFLTRVNMQFDIHVFVHSNREYIERWVIDRMLWYYRNKMGLDKNNKAVKK